MATTLTVVDVPQAHETWAAAIVRRLRGEFSQRGLTMQTVAQMAGMSQTQFSRRMKGRLPFTVDELERVCAAARLDGYYVITGARSLPDATNGSLLLPRLESNQQPFGEYLDANLPAAAGI